MIKKNKAVSTPILLVIFATAFISFAQILYKIGSLQLANTSGGFSALWLSIIKDYPLLLGLAMYAIGAVLLITALKDGELSILYPIIALSYIWVSILSIFFLHETMSFMKWIGIFLIVLGVSFIGFGRKVDTQRIKRKRSKQRRRRR